MSMLEQRIQQQFFEAADLLSQAAQGLCCSRARVGALRQPTARSDFVASRDLDPKRALERPARAPPGTR